MSAGDDSAARRDPARIGVVEDDPHMRAFLESLLHGSPDTDLVFAAGSLADARAALAGLARAGDGVDLCLVDIELPDGLGTDFLAELHAGMQTYSLILTVLGDKVSVISGLEAGASGYLLKDSPPDMILAAIRDTLAGSSPMSAQASTHLIDMLQQNKALRDARPPSTLTERETEILTLFAKGMSYKETAATLSISNNTVGEHVRSIYGKLGVNSRNEAVFEGLNAGWISI